MEKTQSLKKTSISRHMETPGKRKKKNLLVDTSLKQRVSIGN